MRLQALFFQLRGKFTLPFRVGLTALVLTTGCQQLPSEPEPLADFSSLTEQERTTVMILGTAHTIGLSGIDQTAFEGVLELLVNEGFDAVAIERIPASEIEALSTNPEFDPVLDQFVGDLLDIGHNAQRDIGLTSAEANSIMSNWINSSDAKTAIERRDRALTALAAYDPETALIYWDADDQNLYPTYASEHLKPQEGSLNERISLGVALAKRMDHPKVWPIDSHADKDLFFSIVPDLQSGMTEYSVGEAVEALPYVQKTRSLEREAVESNELIHLLAHLNEPETLKDDVIGQFDIFNRVPFPNNSGKVRLAAWDERNIRIAAHIRRATAFQPGGRVLVIIGAGHKPFLDELLDISLDLQVEQIDLKPD